MPFDTEMQFPPFLYTGVLGLLEYESVEPQCQGLASPSVRSRSLSLVHRPQRSPRLAHALDMRGCRGEGDQYQGSPTSYPGKLTVINRINTPHGSLKSVCGRRVGGRGCCNKEISGSFLALMCAFENVQLQSIWYLFFDRQSIKDGRLEVGSTAESSLYS